MANTPLYRRVFVRDLRLDALVGVHAHEKKRRQPLVINLELKVREGGPARRLEDVVCYDALTQTVKAILGRGHVGLLEALAEEIAAACLADPRVAWTRVRLEKPQAIAEADSVGIEIERIQKAKRTAKKT